MTETKRFWILNTLTEYSGIKDKDKLLTFNEVVDLLNKFYEENKELKLQLEAFKDKLYELGVSDAKQYDKRFHIVVSNDNTVRLIDHERSNDLISIGFKKYSDAAECSDALQYLCNLMNGLAEESDILKQLKTEYCTGHLKKSDFEDSQLIIDGNEVNCKIEDLRASGYSDEYINKELGHLANWRI